MWGQAAAGAASSLVGPLMSMGTTAMAQNRARKYQTRFMKNAIQWRMDDMRKAGLNPILAAGSQPPVPGIGTGGGTGSVDTLGAVQKAMAMADELKKVKAERKEREQAIDRTMHQSIQSFQQTQLLNAQTATAKQQARKTAAEAAILERQVPMARVKGDIASSVEKFLRGAASSAKEARKEIRQEGVLPWYMEKNWPKSQRKSK